MTTFFMSTWWGDSKNMEEIEFSWWLFEGRLRQGKNMLPDRLNRLCCFAGSSKSHHENSISFVFLESPSSSRHDIRCQIFQTLFWVFQYSRITVNLKKVFIDKLVLFFSLVKIDLVFVLFCNNVILSKRRWTSFLGRFFH